MLVGSRISTCQSHSNSTAKERVVVKCGMLDKIYRGISCDQEGD